MQISPNNHICFGRVIEAVVGNVAGLHQFPSASIARITRKTNKPMLFAVEPGKDAFKVNVRGSVISVLLLELTRGRKVYIHVPKDYPQRILNAVIGCVKADSDNSVRYIENGFNTLV